MSGLKLDDSDRKRDNWASFFLIENVCIQEDLSDDGINRSRSTAEKVSSGVLWIIDRDIRIAVENHRRIADAAMALTRESVTTADQLNLKHICDINMPVKMTIKIN